MNLNKAMIIGNLTRDPEGRTTPSGASLATFSVATSQKWKDAAGENRERTEFHNIVAWGKLSEICMRYLAKGRKVYVEGRLQTEEWTGQDGAKRRRTTIVAENMILLDRPPEGSQPPAPATADGRDDRGHSAATAKTDEEEIRIEDIPF